MEFKMPVDTYRCTSVPRIAWLVLAGVESFGEGINASGRYYRDFERYPALKALVTFEQDPALQKYFSTLSDLKKHIYEFKQTKGVA